MGFFTRLAILFYVIIISVLCGIVILFVSHAVFLEDIQLLLQTVYSDYQLRIIIGLISAFLVLLSFMFARIIIGRQQREKTIAFDNPSGRVAISLSAMEDLVRRLISKRSEVKEVRPHIVATKKGLDISVKLVLKSDVSIPDMTSDLQESIKRKIQDIIGLEGTVAVKIYVVKIISENAKVNRDTRKNETEIDKAPPTVPYRQYRG